MRGAWTSLTSAAVAVLETPEPAGKVRLTRAAAAAWAAGEIGEIGSAQPPERPARPARPLLRPPREMPRRRVGPGLKGRIALYHALAHIELNAIDLAWDLIARFTGEGLPRAFHDDWVRVAAEEAEHFTLLDARLTALGAVYGDLPAHGGLWEAAQETARDLLARLAVVPLVLEARGLDVTPGLIAKLEAAGDTQGAAVLRVIYEEEIGHVAAGKRWFDTLCRRRGLEPDRAWPVLVRRHFKGKLKPPFNEAARQAAGLSPTFYQGPGPDR